MPVVLVISEQFAKLAQSLMRSREIPESIAIVIEGNPEFVTESRSEALAGEVIAQTVRRLTGAAQES